MFLDKTIPLNFYGVLVSSSVMLAPIFVVNVTMSQSVTLTALGTRSIESGSRVADYLLLRIGLPSWAASCASVSASHMVVYAQYQC